LGTKRHVLGVRGADGPLVALKSHEGPPDQQRPEPDSAEFEVLTLRERLRVYLAYIDESGSAEDVARSRSKSYVLGCVLVRASHWAEAFDGLIGYRHFIRARFGIQLEAEIKANHLLRNSGTFQELSLDEMTRYSLYRGMLRLCFPCHIKAFAIVVKKEQLFEENAHDLAWILLLETLQRLAAKQEEQVLIFHDEAEDPRIRTLAQTSQRAGYSKDARNEATFKVPFRALVDYPVSRRSHDSPFLQLADLVAYAAFRQVFPPPTRSVQIVPARMWKELGAALAEVNEPLDGAIRGIVEWPRLK
jgi:hypothetical protein